MTSKQLLIAGTVLLWFLFVLLMLLRMRSETHRMRRRGGIDMTDIKKELEKSPPQREPKPDELWCFTASTHCLEQFNGDALIVRRLDEKEADPEAGEMWECLSTEGKFHAFREELKPTRLSVSDGAHIQMIKLKNLIASEPAPEA